MASRQQQQQDDGEELEFEPAMLLSMDGKRAVRKAIGFAVDIEHAEALNALFLEAGGLQSGTLYSWYACSALRSALRQPTILGMIPFETSLRLMKQVLVFEQCSCCCMM
jgi:hypothetical protein